MTYKLFIVLILAISSWSCTSKKTSVIKKDVTPATIEGYGYSEKDPVKVGGAFTNGVALSREYLSSLCGLNGEPVTYYRIGSCCPFETKNSPFGGGLLDKYSVKIKGDTVEKIIYINIYDEAALYAPEGFKFRR